jgi:hypothetical protein
MLLSNNVFLIKRGEENVELHTDRYVHQLLQHVRFPMMSPCQVAILSNSISLPLAPCQIKLVVYLWKVFLPSLTFANNTEAYLSAVRLPTLRVKKLASRHDIKLNDTPHIIMPSVTIKNPFG